MGQQEQGRQDPLQALEAKIAACQKELDKINNQRNFPFVYIIVALPTTAIFMLLTYVSQGLIDLTTGITGSLFFSLLITCTYLVLFQPNREEVSRQLLQQIKYLTREKGKLEAGIKGEHDVAYALKWLPGEYLVFNDISLIDPVSRERQQIDHLVIGPNGLFHLETKTINGVILIAENGNWTVMRASQNRVFREAMESPLPQIRRHEAVIRSVLKEYSKKTNLDPVSIVVLAHPQSVVEGHDPALKVLRKDQLNEFIVHYQGPRHLTPKEVRAVTLALLQGTEVQESDAVISN